MTPVEALIKGKEWLATHKWGREYDYNRDTGAYCAVGALYAGASGNEDARFGIDFPHREVVMKAEGFLTKAAGRDIVDFNDYRASRKRQVISVYNKAIKLAQKEGG